MLHALGALVTLEARDPAGTPAPSESPAVPISTIEVEIHDEAPSEAPSGLGDPGAPSDRPLATPANPRQNAAAAGQTSDEPGAPTGDYALDPTAPNTGERSKVDLGIAPGDWSRWTNFNLQEPSPETTAPRRTPSPVSTTGGLAEALEAHDQGVGLGPAGAVLSAAREAGHSDVAPQLGRATFAITVLRTGTVDVQLTGASSNVDGWQKVAANIAAAIKRKPPQINPPRNGVRIGVELAAEERWPSGALARSEGPSVALSGGSIRTVDEAKEDLARRNPAALPPPGSPVDQPTLKANVDLPGLFVQGRGKVCSYKIGVTPFGLGASGGCDPSNIGAPPQRVVSTRVISESMF
jgi:hypothetical protein